jgi:ankyrin repeat protein
MKLSSSVNTKSSRPYHPNINQQSKSNLTATTQPYIIRSRYNHRNEFQLVTTNIASRKINTINFTQAELQTSYEIIDKLITTSAKIIKEAKTQDFNVADLSWVTNQLIATTAEYNNEKYFFVNDFINDVIDYCNTIKHDYNAKYKLINFLTTSSNNLTSFLQQYKKHNITRKSTLFILKFINNIIHFFSSYTKKNLLFKAIANKDNSKVENLLKDIDINIVKNGKTLLMCALSHNNIEVVDTLIKAGIDIDTCYPSGNTILIEAITREKNEFAKKLITYGADLNAKNTIGDSALTKALITNKPDIAKRLIEQGADINLVDTQGNSALMLALIYNQPDIAKRLIELGADVNLKNNYKDSPLTIATKKGYEHIVKILMDTGNITNTNRTKAITLIKKPDEDNLIKTLSKSTISHKTTALMLAIKTDANLELIKNYIKLSPETINAKDETGNTALMIALQFKKKHIAELLISLGADISITNNQGYNALNIVEAKEKSSK